jgi:hypothetical protein
MFLCWLIYVAIVVLYLHIIVGTEETGVTTLTKFKKKSYNSQQELKDSGLHVKNRGGFYSQKTKGKIPPTSQSDP